VTNADRAKMHTATWAAHTAAHDAANAAIRRGVRGVLKDPVVMAADRKYAKMRLIEAGVRFADAFGRR